MSNTNFLSLFNGAFTDLEQMAINETMHTVQMSTNDVTSQKYSIT